MCVLSVLFIYLFFFLRRDCIMGAGLNIESLLWLEESEITLFSTRIGTFTTEEIAVHQSDAC